jgi:TolA-binding protein
MKTRRIALLAALLGAGCAYYNGLYNANRLVSEARKAEREGRTGEARSLWSQVVVKADTVLARYPNSGYRDDARYLKGLALSEVGGCRQAVEPLTLVADSSPDPELSNRGRLRLGRCMLELGNLDSALVHLDTLIENGSAQRDEALWLRGRTYHLLNRNEAARADLEATRSDSAVFDLALVLVALGDSSAGTVLDVATEWRYSEDRWLPVLDTLARQDPGAATRLTRALVNRGSLSRGQRARLLLAEGARTESTDRVEAIALYEEARGAAGDSIEAGVARVRLALAQLRLSDDPSIVPRIVEDLERAAALGTGPANLAAAPLTALNELMVDTAGGPNADLSRYVVTERLRQATGANALAARLFFDIANDYPNSVIAPKALIAASAADEDFAPDLLGLLRRRYPDSPYTLALQGIDTGRYRVVEDSLRTILETLRPGFNPERARRLVEEGDEDELIN